MTQTQANRSADNISFLNLVGNALRTTKLSPKPAIGLMKMAKAKAGRKDSIGLRFEQWAERQPDHPALRFQDEDGLHEWTYGQLNAWANQIAHCLIERGVGQGDAVGIFMENRPEVLATVLATVKLGAIASMLNSSQRGDILVHSINLVTPKLLVVGEELLDATAEIESELPATLLENRYYVSNSRTGKVPDGYFDLGIDSAKMGENNPTSTGDITLEQPAYYIFTSGTTGLPKASKMSHLRWAKASAGFGLAAMRLDRDDILYCCLPLYHNNALTVSWGSVLAVGCTLALAPKFSASRFWDDIRRHNATVFCYIGELCRYLLNSDPKPNDHDNPIKKVIGNGLRPEIWDAFKTRFDIPEIYEFYGASEGNIGFVNSFNLDRTAGFCPLSFQVVAYDIDADEPILDANGHMQKVGKGGVGLLIGEVTERAPYEGYTDASASEKKLYRDVFKTGDCYFNTGDLVRNQGWNHIAFVDRLGDTFRWKGENVATTEIEGVLGNFAGVDQAVVYGVEIPGCDGRAGMAALTLGEGRSELDFTALAEHLRSNLPTYALPLFIRIKAEQEVTGTFKFRKVDLKREGFDPHSGGDPVHTLLPGETEYCVVTDALHERILKRDFRF